MSPASPRPTPTARLPPNLLPIPKTRAPPVSDRARPKRRRFTWDVTRPAMVALMRASMKEFARAQRSVGAKVDVGPPRAEDAAAADAAERLANELAQFPAPPFTSQRLCELLLAPREYYTKIEKLVRFSGPPRAGTRTDAPAPVRR